MVEEHSTNIKTQIESEYSSSNAVHVAANLKNRESAILEGDFKLPDSDIQSLVGAMNAGEKATTSAASAEDPADGAKQQEQAKKGFKCSKPSSIDSKRSRSLCNTSSVDSAEDSKAKKEVGASTSGIGKPQSNPTKCDNNQNDNNEVKISDEVEIKTNVVEDKSSPTDNLIGAEFLNLSKPESPKPGSSTQPDHGKQILYTII